MKPSLNEIKKKTIFMVCIVAVLLALLVLRVAYWQIIRGDELSSKAKAQQQAALLQPQEIFTTVTVRCLRKVQR